MTAAGSDFSNDSIIKDALKITKMLHQHLRNQDCQHCREILEAIFSDD